MPYVILETPGEVGEEVRIYACTLMLPLHTPTILSQFVPKFAESTAPLGEGPDNKPFSVVLPEPVRKRTSAR